MTATLPSNLAHQFTPQDLDATRKDALEPLFETLLAMPVDDEVSLKAFLSAWNELHCFAHEAHASQRLLSAQHTDRDDYRDAVLAYAREVQPSISEWGERLGRKLLGSPCLSALDGTAFEPFVRQIRQEVELFQEDNLPIEQKLAELDQRYGELSGAWTVEFEGDTRTFPSMSRFLMSPTRPTRKGAWEAMGARLFADADALDDLWEEMFGLRQSVATNAGYDNYRDYIFAEKLRDYDPDACFAYHDLIASEVTPLVKAIAEDRKTRLGLDRYRPWDGLVDPDGNSPLAPFEDVEALFGGVARMMDRLDPTLGEQFKALHSFMDLDNRTNKRQGGFMLTLRAQRRPFIFANATGRHHDIITLLHEAGHAFHALAAAPMMPMSETSVPMEFNEVASMAMELLHYKTLDEFYTEAQQARAIKEHLARIPMLLCRVAHGDAFQHWLYTHPEHTRAQRHDRWLLERERFLPIFDYEGLDEGWQRCSWHRILHFFIVPFYFIEYGFAQLGALQVAVNADKDPAAALAAYKEGLSLGATRDTAGLYEAVGAQFVPTRQTLRTLMDWIRAGLGL